MNIPYNYEKEHTKECNENADKQHQDFSKKADALFEDMKAKGIDTSMRGVGFQCTCTCKTQETK